MTPIRLNLLAAAVLSALAIPAAAQVSGPCPRFAAGSTVTNPPALFSNNGVLSVDLSYNTAQDADGRTPISVPHQRQVDEILDRAGAKPTP